MVTQRDHKSAWMFFVIAYAFSWAFWIPSALAAHGVPLPTPLITFLNSPWNPAPFGPLFSAFLLTLIQKGGKGALQLLRGAVDFRFKKIWLLAILLLPFVLFYGAISAIAVVRAEPLDLSVISNPPYAIVGFFVILFTAGPLQEEFGWRGYALPRLQTRFNALAASAILGGFWWLWHLPAVFIPGKFMVGDLGGFLVLLVVILLTAILFTWVYNNTNGSILAAILMHTAMNWAIWLARPSMKMDLPTLGVLIGFLAVAVLIVIRIWGKATLSRERGSPS